MKSLVLCAFFLFGVLAASAYPSNYGRLRRTPYQHKAMMFTGYYGNPYRRSAAYAPESGMTAFASGETLATNQYGVNSQYPVQEPVSLDFPLEENPVKDVPLEDQTEIVLKPESHSDSAELEPIPVPSKPKRIPKRKPQRPEPEEDEEEDEDEGYNPFAAKSGRGQQGNVFFPIVFRGYSGARTRNAEEGGYPGSATAIANSFSTGKGGVASSHATAYGDPYAGMYFRGANGKRKAQHE